MVINGYSKGQAFMMDNNNDTLELLEWAFGRVSKDETFLKNLLYKQEPMKTQILLKNKND